jgi:hypothetical protein
VGDWRNLSRLLDDFGAGRYPLLIEILVERGPFGLCEIAQNRHGYQPLSGGYAGKCHLCVDVRRHLVERAEHQELRPLAFYANF